MDLKIEPFGILKEPGLIDGHSNQTMTETKHEFIQKHNTVTPHHYYQSLTYTIPFKPTFNEIN